MPWEIFHSFPMTLYIIPFYPNADSIIMNNCRGITDWKSHQVTSLKSGQLLQLHIIIHYNTFGENYIWQMAIAIYDAPDVYPITYVSQKHVTSSLLFWPIYWHQSVLRNIHFDITSESPDELRCCLGLTVFRQELQGTLLNTWSSNHS